MKIFVSFALMLAASSAFAHQGAAHSSSEVYNPFQVIDKQDSGSEVNSPFPVMEKETMDAAIIEVLEASNPVTIRSAAEVAFAAVPAVTQDTYVAAPEEIETPIAFGTENHHLEMMTGIVINKGAPNFPTNELDEDDFAGVRETALTPAEQLLYAANANIIQGETAGLAFAPPPAQPGSTVGRWTDVFGWDIIAIHATLLPTGRVLIWDATPDDFDGNDSTNGVSATQVRLWDPVANASQPTDYYQANLFCAGSAHLWDGRILFTGGDAGPSGSNIPILDSTIYNPYDNSWIKTPNMNTSRWYASVAVLSNGEMFTVGGTHISGVKKPSEGVFSEVFEFNKTWRALGNVAPFFGDNTTGEYMWAQTLPNGNVGVFGPHASVHNISTAGQGNLTAKYSRTMSGTAPGYRGYGSYVLYDEGKVLITGGGLPQGVGSSSKPSKSAVVIDLYSNAVSAAAEMNFPRRQHNLTLLADGSVLASGGHSGDEYLIDLNPDNQVHFAEIWKDGVWNIVSEMPETRQYHSVAILLPDGRVFSGGGGYCGDCIDQKTYEIYSPPYLFKAGTSDRIPDEERPQLSNVPDRVNYGQNFQVQLNGPSQDIVKAHLIKLGSVTHSQNQGQRLAKVTWNQMGNALNITAPIDRNLAPPGHYMLIAIDSAGVPSKGAILRIGQPLLKPGDISNDIFLGAEQANTYEILPEGRTGLEITLSQAAAGAQIFAASGEFPNDGSASVAIGEDGGTGTLTVGGDGQSPWYIQVRGPNDSAYSLRARLADAPPVVTPEPEPPVVTPEPEPPVVVPEPEPPVVVPNPEPEPEVDPQPPEMESPVEEDPEPNPVIVMEPEEEPSQEPVAEPQPEEDPEQPQPNPETPTTVGDGGGNVNPPLPDDMGSRSRGGGCGMVGSTGSNGPSGPGGGPLALLILPMILLFVLRRSLLGSSVGSLEPFSF